ncbi:MAG TPA: RluA family pseudouridine synthase [Myxococcales bacterium]
MRILYRDEHVLVVDKPAGVLTVPGRRDASVALSVAVREVAPEALPVHRLDRDTSGVLVFGLGRAAHRALNAAFEDRRAEKSYLALVEGDLAEARKIDLPLSAGRRGGMRAGGDLEAVTEVRPTERFGRYTWCTCLPRTGRTHQIRVHLAAIGHPLAVDPRYGSPGPLRARTLWAAAPDPEAVVLDRTPLHAASLRLPHPSGKGWLLVESPLPADLARCLDLLRAARRATSPG